MKRSRELNGLGFLESVKTDLGEEPSKRDGRCHRIGSAGHATTAIGSATGTSTTHWRRLDATDAGDTNSEHTVTASKRPAVTGGVNDRGIGVLHSAEQGDDFTILDRLIFVHRHSRNSL
jgi:hypothetical protein